MIILELFDEAKEQVFYDEFRDHVIIMENFLSGWSQYDRLVSEGEANISLMLNENNLPPFSCEAVFIREHIVEVK